MRQIFIKNIFLCRTALTILLLPLLISLTSLGLLLFLVVILSFDQIRLLSIQVLDEIQVFHVKLFTIYFDESAKHLLIVWWVDFLHFLFQFLLKALRFGLVGRLLRLRLSWLWRWRGVLFKNGILPLLLG